MIYIILVINLKRKKLCMIELFCIILIPIIVLAQIFIICRYIYEIFRCEIIVDSNNQKRLEEIIQDSKYNNLENVNKIQYISAIHHDRYVVYYNDGSEVAFTNDNYEELRDYIQNNGKEYGSIYYILFICSVIIFIVIIIIKHIVKKEIEKIDCISRQ